MLPRRKIAIAIAFLTACLFANQNCTSALESQKSDSQSTAPQREGGDGYDGKLFINRLIGSICPDGSDIRNSVEVKSFTEALVTRENCLPVNKTIDNSQFSFMPHNENNLIYANRAFDLAPTTSKDPRSTTYLCGAMNWPRIMKSFMGLLCLQVLRTATRTSFLSRPWAEALPLA